MEACRLGHLHLKKSQSTGQEWHADVVPQWGGVGSERRGRYGGARYRETGVLPLPARGMGQGWGLANFYEWLSYPDWIIIMYSYWPQKTSLPSACSYTEESSGSLSFHKLLWMLRYRCWLVFLSHWAAAQYEDVSRLQWAMELWQGSTVWSIMGHHTNRNLLSWSLMFHI